MRKNIILSVFFVFFSLIVGQGMQASAQTVFVEDFDYTAGQALTGLGWTAHSGAGTNPVTVTSPGLTYSGYPSAGNAVSLATSGEDVHKTFAVQSSGSIYAAFLVNVSEASVDPAGGYFLHLGPDPISTTFRARVFAKKDASNNVSFGISKALTGAAEIAFTPFSYSLNTTYLLVVKYTIVDGATNDVVSLIVNPTLPGTEPAATVTATDTAQSDINPGSIALRQGATATSPTVRVDGIRVGTTWASVTGASGPAPDSNVDMNGDGKTDYVVIRGTGSPLTEGIASVRQRMAERRAKRDAAAGGVAAFWYVLINGTNTFYSASWGDATTDTAVPEDYDGDGKDDIAVWRAGDASTSAFYILHSADNTFRIVPFGGETHDPTVTGDYDGDNKADPATYFCQSFDTPAPCSFGYLSSVSNQIVVVQWGFGVFGDNVPAPGDYDGDGKYDFCVQREEPGSPGIAQFALLTSTGATEFIDWGVVTDVIEPGDYDGDNKNDFMVARLEGGVIVHYLLTRTGSFSVSSWGVTGDIPSPGDYNGDGRDDISVYRTAAAPNSSTFYTYIATNGSVLVQPWGNCQAGQPCDVPAANWYVH